MTRQIDMTGYQFGRLVVLHKTSERYGKRQEPLWLCYCNCGNAILATRPALVSQNIRSCGCWQIESRAATNNKFRTHSMTNSPTYASWRSMLTRCENPNQGAIYDRYGGRGIKVCERWHQFENFLADMGERPPHTTLDRYPDPNGDYKPGNCRWATIMQQRHNQSNITMLTYRGTTKHINEWAAQYGIQAQTIKIRIRKKGWSVHDALTTKLYGT